jgi:serine/threonine-protein kinase
MTDDPRLQQLLDELLDSGGTPEEVCGSYPELLPEVRARWRQICRAQAEIDALFPTPTAPEETPPAETREDMPLPRVPGHEVEAVIGRGGVGIVYRARHLRLNRPVALKMLLAGPYARAEELERFLREAEAVAALRHPNIVQIYDVGDADRQPYFTMELVEGGNLGAKAAGMPQQAGWAASLVATLAGAIHVAHQSGIVHRDLKPGNVLLTADGVPKVTDFGLVRRLEGEESLTLSGVPVGTPSYMAPEQARGDKGAIGPATDVYALGAILYDLLTGRPPFRGETATATLHQVMADEPVTPGRLNPAVPRDLQTICLKCLDKEPTRRYASAQALADDLRRFERHEPITARPPGTLDRTAKWVRRRPAAAAVLAASLLILAGVTTAAVWYADDRARLRAEAQSRGREVNREANAALHDAEKHLKSLRAKLDDQVQVQELLSDIDQWQAVVRQARQDRERARSATVGNEALVTKENRDLMQAIEAAVAREEVACGLASDLDTIAVEAFASYDTRLSPQRKAVAEYERFFAGQGLDIHQPGTDWFAPAVRSSPIRFALIAALDNWAWLAGFLKDPQVARLLELTRAADPDPWRDRFRDPAVWADREALTRLANEVDVGAQSPTVLVSLGWRLPAKGQDPKALFERALLDHPRDFWLHLNACLLANEPGVKIALAHAALAIRPRNAPAYGMIAWFLWTRGDYPGALVAAHRAIDIKPNYAGAHFTLGLALRDTNDLPGAVAALRRAADLDPGNHGPCWYLGNVLRLQGDGAAGADADRKAADRLGILLRERKGRPGAVAEYQRAVEGDPGNSLARYSLGQLLQQQGRYAEAEQAYLGAIKVQPACVLAHDALAQLLATCQDDKSRDGKRAIEYATTACELSGWKDPLCVHTLAAACAAAGRFEEAVRFQTRALDDPTLKGDLRTAAMQRLEMYRQKKPFREKGP